MIKIIKTTIAVYMSSNEIIIGNFWLDEGLLYANPQLLEGSSFHSLIFKLYR